LNNRSVILHTFNGDGSISYGLRLIISIMQPH